MREEFDLLNVYYITFFNVFKFFSSKLFIFMCKCLGAALSFYNSEYSNEKELNYRVHEIIGMKCRDIRADRNPGTKEILFDTTTEEAANAKPSATLLLTTRCPGCEMPFPLKICGVPLNIQ